MDEWKLWNNLISLTNGMWHSDVGWGSLPADNEGVWLDETETYNGEPSFRIMGGGNGSGNTGADHEWLDIKPGDRIVFTCYIKTGAPSIERSLDFWMAGARIGMDLGDKYGLQGEGSFGISDPNGLGVTTEQSNTWVKFANSLWQQRKVDFIVQEKYVSNQVNTNTFTPDFVIPWFQVYSSMDGINETGFGWFAKPEFYINPSPIAFAGKNWTAQKGNWSVI